MTPNDFINSWTNINQPLSLFTPSSLNRFKLLQSTIDFLTIAGLPFYCEPNLSFANDTDDNVLGINKLTEQFSFEEEMEYDKYIVFGSCRDGDPIAFNTNDNDKIKNLKSIRIILSE